MPFAWVAEALTPLFKKWETWVVITLIAVIFYVLSLQHQLAAAKAALAARPTVHIEAEQQVKTVRVAGPVHYETETVYVPGTNTVQYVDRIITRDPVTTTTQKDSEVKKDEKPSCPAPAAAHWRYAGITLDPDNGGVPSALRGGVTLWGRFDAGASYDWKHHAPGLDAAVRF